MWVLLKFGDNHDFEKIYTILSVSEHKNLSISTGFKYRVEKMALVWCKCTTFMKLYLSSQCQLNVKYLMGYLTFRMLNIAFRTTYIIVPKTKELLNICSILKSLGTKLNSHQWIFQRSQLIFQFINGARNLLCEFMWR